MQHLRLAAAAAALLAVCAAGGAHAQTFTGVEAEARSFHLGAFEFSAIRDNALKYKNASVFGRDTDPAEVAKVLAAHGASTDGIPLDVDALVVRTPGHVALLDTGLGVRLHGVLIASLAKAGVSPDQVTDVFIAHSHLDHVGGLLDGHGHSAFPNAAIRMSANEWAFLQSQAGAKALAAAIGPQVKTFEPGQPAIPGITPIASYGHTPGHVVYEVSSGDKTLVDIGDTAHSVVVSLAKPDWPMAFDGDKPAAARARRAELAHLADEHLLIFAPHFPFPGVGRVERAGDGFVFKPEVPAQ